MTTEVRCDRLRQHRQPQISPTIRRRTRGSAGRRARRRRCRAASASAARAGWSRRSSLLVWVVLVTKQSDWAQRITERVDAAFLRQIAATAHRLADRRVRARQPDRVGLGASPSFAIGLLIALMVFRRWRHLFTFVGSVLVLELLGVVHLQHGSPGPRPFDVTIIGGGGVLVPVGAGRGRDDHRRRDHLLDGRAGSRPHDREGRRVRGDRVRRRRPAVSRRRPSLRRLRQHRRRRGVAAQRVPLLHAQRGVPGRVPAGQDRAPRRRRSPGRSDPRGGRASARHHRAGHQARRARRVGWLDAAATPRRGRSRHVPVREALRDEPRARRPLVQARPDASSTDGSRTKRRSNRCGGWCSTRTTRCG